MSGAQLLTLWSDSQALSIVIWLLVLLVALYLARSSAHRMIAGFGGAVRQAMRLASRSVMLAERYLIQRNREVLLSMAEENYERLIEREFHRVNAVVNRDLGDYPTLHRTLTDQLMRIEEDYKESTEVPPQPPAWVDVIEAVAKIRSNGDPMVERILDDIRDTLEKSSREALEEYRSASLKRHVALRRILPHWRRVSETLGRVDKTITGLDERAREIDAQMGRYEQIRAKADHMTRTLSSSSMTQFLISGLVLVIAAFGGFINFHLIALPMSEMVGGAATVGPMRVSDIAALVIIMVEIAMGLFLMESLRITRLFPVIHALDDQMRTRMIWISFTILLTMASIESALAYMRDMLAADQQALVQMLAANGGSGQPPELRWIPSIGQMVMGFVLPFALTFVAIPLESFIYSGRTVIGVMGVGALRVLRFILRLIGNIFFNLGKALIHFYDLLIFLPLSFEALIVKAKANRPAEAIVVAPENNKEIHP